MPNVCAVCVTLYYGNFEGSQEHRAPGGVTLCSVQCTIREHRMHAVHNAPRTIFLQKNTMSNPVASSSVFSVVSGVRNS